jgi:hypothetical protein
MPKWEYQTIILKRELKLGFSASLTQWSPSIDLDRLGEEGWELVSIVPIANYQGDASGLTHQLHYVFKRQK